ncbi:hypothetical protein EMEDMD4_210027 [Sinorhizobium medicae]|uniref:Uncharacterized protein n=1 Tax=Sinorhizobium medicae TaxID=110321 RepID=A0A508WTX0_9HYPH|nr:hypothetical protein EMEDMD4_210027 [Sinorhizobium medicae]
MIQALTTRADHCRRASLRTVNIDLENTVYRIARRGFLWQGAPNVEGGLNDTHRSQKNLQRGGDSHAGNAGAWGARDHRGMDA